MSGEDRQSELAREHKERQAQRAAEQAAKGRRNTFIGAGVAIVAVVGGIIAATTLMGGGDDSANVAAESTPSASVSVPAAPTAMPSMTPTGKAAPVSCTYKKDTTAGVPTKFVGLPGKKPNQKLSKMTVTTNHGPIVIDLDPNVTPCTVNSFDFLAKKNFYDDTKCHRLVTPQVSGLFLLQCGDPLAKGDGKSLTDGQGTAGYVFTDENIGGMPYSRGVVFMTQPGGAAGQNSSQFAISLSDDNSQIQDEFTPFGVVIEGIEMIEEIAKQGVIVNEADVTGDGGATAPKNPIIIKDVKLTE